MPPATTVRNKAVIETAKTSRVFPNRRKGFLTVASTMSWRFYHIAQVGASQQGLTSTINKILMMNCLLREENEDGQDGADSENGDRIGHEVRIGHECNADRKD